MGGGVLVNANAQAVDTNGDVIPRLYCTGTMCGGWKGKVNAGCGQALGWSYASGRIAGEHVLTLDPVKE